MRAWMVARTMAVFTLGSAAVLAGPSATAPAANRPNVLLLLTDDQRADTIAALGNPAIRTPHLDTLARAGLAFTNAYILGSNAPAVCLPSRNMLLSGRAYFRWEGPQAPADGPNFPNALRAAGYLTYHHGKRGNSAVAIQERFEVNKYLREEAERQEGEPGRQIVDEAVAFLRTRPADRPFFMYLAFANPHDPRVAAPEDLAAYDRSRIPLPPDFLPLHPFDNGEMLVRDELLAPWPRTPDEIGRHLHEYYAVITGLDRQIGRLMTALNDLGVAGNTVVIFSSDNGLAIGSHGLMGKQSLYEHSAKVPLIIAGPGIAPGRCDALVYLLDLLPTVCDLVGAEIPEGLDGRSIRPLLEGRTKAVREDLFTAYRDSQRAIRDARWKLIRYPLIDRTQLFDLATDPCETRDRSADPDQAPRIARMMSLLAERQRQFGDHAPLRVSEPRDAGFVPPTGAALEEIRAKWRIR